MSSQSPVEEVSRENGLKRRRVSVACANCRARKSRVGQTIPLLYLLTTRRVLSPSKVQWSETEVQRMLASWVRVRL